MEVLLGDKKFDRIMHQSFLWEKEAGSNRTGFEQFGETAFTYYREDKLICIRQNPVGQWYRVQAGEANEDGLYPPAEDHDEPSCPRLICTVYINRQKFKFNGERVWFSTFLMEPLTSVCSISTTRALWAIKYPGEEVLKDFVKARSAMVKFVD